MRLKPQDDSGYSPFDQALVLALRALAFVASQPELIERLLAVTGLTPEQLRDAAEDPALLVGVLDFLLAHEPDLVAFCEAEGCDPAAPAEARRCLAGGGERGCV